MVARSVDKINSVEVANAQQSTSKLDYALA